MLKDDFSKDELTGLPNFTKFFTDDYKSIYGKYGFILLLKIRSLKKINEKFGKKAGDFLLRALGQCLLLQLDRPKYRHEGNGFIVIYREMDRSKAECDLALIEMEMANFFDGYQIENSGVHSEILKYNKPIKSAADYYQLLYEHLKKSASQAENANLLHQLFEELSHKVNKMIRQYGVFKEYALIDEVSDLPNSKYAKLFLDTVDLKFEKYAIILIDGDNLREYNEISYSHGNFAIKKIGELIQASVRKSDRVFRWLSGDEFLVLTTDIDKIDIDNLAERIRSTVEEYFRNSHIPTTVSLGISSKPQNGNSIKEVLKYAEEANKIAKCKGKNCIVYHERVEEANHLLI